LNIQVDGIGEEQGRERNKCYTDLFYLCNRWLGYDLSEQVHRPVCDFFVHKDPAKEIEDQDVIKDRLLLDPREHYKTTIDVGDIVQWIITQPNIRIALFSGADVLTQQIMDMVRNHFLINDEFKELFPEFALDEETKGTLQAFNTPARTNWRLREPTVFASTLGSVSTGGHFNVHKYDDVVTSQNAETKDQLGKTRTRIASLHPILIVGGYRDFVGTRYDFDDAYGKFIDDIKEDECTTTSISFGTIRTGTSWKIFERTACSLPYAENSTILFTENGKQKKAFSYKELEKRRKSMGDYQYGCQYLNDPTWGQVATFEESLLREALVPFEAIPLLRRSHLDGQIYIGSKAFITWDMAFSAKTEADRSVGAAGCFDTLGRLYLFDLEVGRFSPDQFVLKFLTLAQKWYPFLAKIGIEEAGGSALIGPALRTAASNANINLPIEWIPTGNVKRAKEERIFGLLPLLKNKRMFIVKDLPYLEELIKEFTRYSPRAAHDDIPDAVSRLLRYQSSVSMVPNASDVPQAGQGDPLLGYGFVG